MITREADYCIRIVLHLSKPEHRKQPVPVNELARAMTIPSPFLRKILAKLIEAGMVVSYRGRNGGLSLRGEPGHVSLLDILRLTDGKGLLLNQCLEKKGICTHQGTCTVHGVMHTLQATMEGHLQAITFEQLI
jgi:Rrf2 family protein